MNQTLDGAYVRLVPLALSHHQRLCEIGLDEELWRFTTIQVQTESEMLEYIQHALDQKAAGTCQPYAISEQASGDVIGTTRYHSINPEHRNLEIGFTWIGRRWQQTIANTETKYLMLMHAFEDQHCLRVQFKTDVSNERSQRALLRIGARSEGVLRSFVVSKNRGPRDLAVFSILSTEWPDVRYTLERLLEHSTG